MKLKADIDLVPYLWNWDWSSPWVVPGWTVVIDVIQHHNYLQCVLRLLNKHWSINRRPLP